MTLHKNSMDEHISLGDKISKFQFFTLCLGGFLLSISYGLTFLIPLLVKSKGGNEADAGLIISIASVSTVVMVIFSGHISDMIGTTKSVVLSSIFLAVSCFIFAVSDAPVNSSIMLMGGVSLGIGWAVFFTLGPIIVTAFIGEASRIRCFALLSGSMMCGFAVGPLLGRGASLFDLPLVYAFWIGAFSSFLGGCIIYLFYLVTRTVDVDKNRVTKIDFSKTLEIVKSDAIFPITIVGLLGCIFGGFASFQTSYASYHGMDYSVFYITFMGSAIFSRLFLSKYILGKNPYIMSFFFSFLIVVSMVGYYFVNSNLTIYLVSSIIFGIGYGLCYSVITGIAANDAPQHLVPQALLFYSLSYLFCVFTYPLIAGRLIVDQGVETMTLAIGILSLFGCMITLVKLCRTSSTLYYNKKDR